MKKYLLLLLTSLLMTGKTFSQTVYVTQTGTTYHTNKCKLYTTNFEAVPLWKAMDAYGKKPCTKCHPPTKETKSVPQKKTAQQKSTGTANPPNKKRVCD